MADLHRCGKADVFTHACGAWNNRACVFDSLYHSVNLTGKALKAFKKIDHMMIFVLIAGTYTPICIIALPQPIGMQLLILVWGIALLGIVVKMFWVTCPKWFSSLLYISMGWTCVLAFTQLLNSLPMAAFGWLLAGGIIYTIGGVIYALKLPIFNAKHEFFGSHEIFHLFVMGGSICHFIVMYGFVAGMPLMIFLLLLTYSHTKILKLTININIV